MDKPWTLLKHNDWQMEIIFNNIITFNKRIRPRKYRNTWCKKRYLHFEFYITMRSEAVVTTRTAKERSAGAT